MRLQLFVTMALMSLGIASSATLAQSTPPEAPSMTPTLYGLSQGVQDESRRIPLVIESLDVNVEAHGGTAVTTMLMRFSSASENAEARLAFDLPDGAIMTGYALDVDGALIQGSLVDQPKAQESFNQQVRGRVDPGLAEVTRNGAFSTRVFPVGPSGRTISIRYTAPIGEALEIPLRLAADTKSWTVSVTGQHGDVRLARHGARSHANFRGTGALDTVLRIAPASDTVLASRHSSGETYWQISGELPQQGRKTRGTMKVFWDRSRSSLDDDHAAALRSITSAVDELAPSAIELVLFNATDLDRTRVGSIAELTSLIEGVRYGGASSLDLLDAEETVDTCLLVSDAQTTLGEGSLFAPKCRLFAIASEDANLAPLGALADGSGGAVVTSGSSASWSTSGITSASVNGEAATFVSVPTLAGKYRVLVKAAPDAAVRLATGSGDLLVPSPTGVADYEGDAQLYQARANAILEQGADRDQFVVHSQRYSLASASLPFLVLESVEDYLRFDVSPTPDHPSYARWELLRAEKDELEAEDREDRFAALLASWQSEVEWWEREFAPVAANSVGADGKVPGRPRPIASAPTTANEPPPPPPPPPPPEPERDGEMAEDAVVVTGAELTNEFEGTTLGLNVDVEELVTTVPVGRNLTEVVLLAPGTTAGSNEADSRVDGIRIAVAASNPDRPYLNAFDQAPDEFEKLFAEWEEKAGHLPVFYLDTSDWLWNAGERELAVEMLLSALDLPLANATTYWMVAARAERWGMTDLAVWLREREARMASHRPQARRALALALAERARRQPDSAQADLERAIDLLTDVALEPLDNRWEGIDVIALREANALIPRLEELGGDVSLDPRLIANLDSDIRVIMEWSADDVDLDMHVQEPSGEQVYYGHNRSLIGGRLSNDMTNGFGPEEYWVRRDPGGRFTIESNMFRNDRIDPNGTPRLYVRLIRDFGRPEQREEIVDLEMGATQSNRVTLGTIRLSPAR